MDAFAHEPALHVGEGDDDGVDPTVADHRLELGQTRVLGGVAGGRVVVGHRGTFLMSSSDGSGALRRNRTAPD